MKVEVPDYRTPVDSLHPLAVRVLARLIAFGQTQRLIGDETKYLLRVARRDTLDLAFAQRGTAA